MSTTNSIAFPNTQPNVVYFTTSGTWTKPAGLRYVVVQLQGGGGAGGGVPAGATFSNSFIGGGGGAGSYIECLIPASSLGATVNVTVGAGGVGVSAGNGGSGAASSFGTSSASGGAGSGSLSAGGYTCPTHPGASVASTPVALGTTIRSKRGNPGRPSHVIKELAGGQNRCVVIRGGGGNPFVGSGAVDSTSTLTDSSSNLTGAGSISLGGGGGGSCNVNALSASAIGGARAGGNGGAGYVRVFEYF